MAEGLSNAGIAERLVVSLGAVEKHISNVFTKLDLDRTSTRTAACSRADVPRRRSLSRVAVAATGFSA